VITAFVSDIHANLAAFQAVLRDMERLRVDTLVCLGDTVGYGPRPAECLDLMLRRCRISVIGNHDLLAAYYQYRLEGLREDVADGIILARNTVRESDAEALRKLPFTLRIGDTTCVHSSLEAPAEFPYILSRPDARRHLAQQSTLCGFFGHSHVAEAWVQEGRKVRRIQAGEEEIHLVEGAKYAINVGSVGQPRDGDPRACYAVYNSHSRTVRWRRVPYDISVTTRAMASLGMSAFSIERLSLGI